MGGVSAFLELFGMNDELSKMSGELDLLRIGDVGPPKTDNAVLKPELTHLCDVLSGVVFKIEPFDICAHIGVVLDRRYFGFDKHFASPWLSTNGVVTTTIGAGRLNNPISIAMHLSATPINNLGSQELNSARVNSQLNWLVDSQMGRPPSADQRFKDRL